MKETYGNKKGSVLKVLVDSGAQVSLINRNLVDADCWEDDIPTVRFKAANQTYLPGGDRGLNASLTMKGRTEHGKSYALNFPALLYGAEIQADVILSYPWLAAHGMAVVAVDHAMVWLTGPELYWVDGQKRGTPLGTGKDLSGVSVCVGDTCPDLDDLPVWTSHMN